MHLALMDFYTRIIFIIAIVHRIITCLCRSDNFLTDSLSGLAVAFQEMVVPQNRQRGIHLRGEFLHFMSNGNEKFLKK